MMNRRSFLAGGLGLLGAGTLAGCGGKNAPASADAPITLPAAADKPAMAHRLTLVHTNDTHSHLEPADSGEYAGLGGVAMRATLLRELRARHDNLLLLDCGDIFQGTPYFNIFQGEPEIKAMNAMNYVAGTIGNHEFDAGIDRLAEMMKLAQFPFLNCNYDLKDTPLNGLSREHLIIEQNGLRIGLLGVGIRLEGLVSLRMVGNTRYQDPVENARRVARHLRNEEKCDFVICLSHINLEEGKGDRKDPGDRTLIREIPEIDVVLGGHNHFLLPAPEALYRDKKPMGYVAQAGWAGTHLGFLQFDIFDDRKRELAMGRPLTVGA